MSVFAWLGEAIRPGPVGKIEFGKPLKRTRRRIVVLIRFTAALAIVVLLLRYVLLDANNHWIQGTELLLVAAFVPTFRTLGIAFSGFSVSGHGVTETSATTLRAIVTPPPGDRTTARRRP